MNVKYLVSVIVGMLAGGLAGALVGAGVDQVTPQLRLATGGRNTRGQRRGVLGGDAARRGQDTLAGTDRQINPARANGLSAPLC